MIAGLTGAVGNHVGVTCGLGQFDGVESLGHGTDLVQLDQDGVAHALVDAVGKDVGVGNEQVVAHQLDAVAHFFRLQGKAVPVGLGQAVFDGDQRELAGEIVVEIDQLSRGKGLVLTSEHVLAVLVEFGSSCINGVADFLARLIPCTFNSASDVLECLGVGLEVRSESALVAYAGDMTVLGKDGFELMENLSTHAKGLGKCLRANGHDHELLDIQVVGSVFATIDDVHEGYGQQFGIGATEVLVQGQAKHLGTGTGRSHGNAEQRVGAKSFLVFSPVQINEQVVEGYLTKAIHTDNGTGNFAAHVFNCGHDTFTAIPLFFIPQFQGFTGAGGCTGGHSSPADNTGFEDDFYLYGGVTA